MRGVVAAALAGAALTSYAALDAADLVPGLVTVAPAPAPRAPETTTAPSPPVPVPTPATADGLPSSADESAPVPTGPGLGAALGPALAEPSLARAGVVVRDVATGTTLLERESDTPLVPASTLKLLSALAVDAGLPPETTLSTRVVDGGAPDRVVLVAGGDMLLAPDRGEPAAVAGRAGLGDLAEVVAGALRAQGRTSVVLQVDPSYAPGPLVAPTWPRRFLSAGFTGPVAMLGLATHQADAGKPAAADPPAEVAATLATRLRERGVTASVDPAPARAQPSAAVLGEVRSAPVVELLGLALETSDNALTESLARQAAFRSGAPTDFAGAAAYVRDRVAAAGVDVTGVTLVDASGLSGGNAVPARVVADVLHHALTADRPGLRAAMRRLPIAALTGTLADRYAAPAAHAGAGVVRAKTGTLSGANSLAGSVVTADGRLLAFVVLQNGRSVGTLDARASLDRFAAALAGCGCR